MISLMLTSGNDRDPAPCRHGGRMTLSSSDTVCRSDRIAQRLFDERQLVIGVDDSMLHRFNETGTFIWGLLEKPCTVGEICRAVADHFGGGTADGILADVTAFVALLKKKRLVSIGASRGVNHGR